MVLSGITDIYQGTSPISKVYQGNTVIWQSGQYYNYKKLTDISEINSASTYFILYDSSAVSYDAIIQGFTDVNIISDSLIDLPNEDPQDSYLNIFRFKYKNGKIYRLSKQNTYYRYETILYPEYNNNTYTFFAYYPGDEPEYPSNITINFINYNNEVRMTLNDGTRTYTFGERGTYPVPRFSNGTGYAIYELIN